ncbi:MAG: hypothetical protein ACI94O_001559 [Octadecabacter sp.]|jgi:hypothetical protein
MLNPHLIRKKVKVFCGRLTVEAALIDITQARWLLSSHGKSTLSKLGATT